MEAAFRTVPVDPRHKPFIVVNFEGFWLDHVHPFGCASSGGNHGEIADFTIDCWKALGVGPALKWVDDFVVFASPRSGSGTAGDPFAYPYDLSRIKSLLAPLRIPWHPTKGQEFRTTFDYVGFHWDISSREVSLSQEKRLKFKNRTDLFLASFKTAPASLDDAMTLNGSLSHIAFVYPHARAYLPNLCAFIADFKGNRFSTRHPSHSLLSDLRWWSNLLDNPSWTRSLRPPTVVLDLGIWVDASTSWGIGLIWGNGDHWDAWQVREGWRGPGRDIGWLEAVAVELAILTMVDQGIRDAQVLINSDNQGVIGACDKGRGNNFQVNFSIRRNNVLFLNSNLSICLNFVESEKNLADPISRGILGPRELQLSSSFSLPAMLSPYLVHA